MSPPPSWLVFLEREFPSANSVLVRGSRPLLIDSGYGSDLAATETLLRAAGTPPEALHGIVNTHYHSDHVGGNHGLQERYRLPIAAHRLEGDLVNRREPETCAGEWLDQPVEPYRVDRLLAEGDEIDAGSVTLQVLHTPGHTTGHLSFFAPRERVLIAGDSFHGRDVGWINPFREGVNGLRQALDSLERLDRLGAVWACSGHGPAIAEPASALAAARRRYESWLTDPAKAGWHAAKRIFAYALMLKDGLPVEEVVPYLLGTGWFPDYSQSLLGRPPAELAPTLLEEMLRSGGVAEREGRLFPVTPYTSPPPGWLAAVPWPRSWPRS
jgi:hydroxyacylglutathione hydrolase